MPSILDDVFSQPTGAQFFRADLHIHSFGASHDVKDSTMTPDAIVQMAVKEGLSIIAITDNVQAGSIARSTVATAAPQRRPRRARG